MMVNPSIIRCVILFFPVCVAYALLFIDNISRGVFPFLILFFYFLASAYRIYSNEGEVRIVSFWTNKVWACKKDQVIVIKNWAYPYFLKVNMSESKEFNLSFFLYSKSDIVAFVECVEKNKCIDEHKA